MTGTGTLFRRRGRGFRVTHATVAKEAKVDTRNGIHGGLCGLRVIFSLGTKKRPEGDYPSGLKTNRRFAKDF